MIRYLYLVRRCFVGVVLTLLLSACSLSPNYLRKELANQGPMVLSRENPYLAPNLFLALEKDASPIIDKFTQHRGDPRCPDDRPTNSAAIFKDHPQ